MNKLSVQAWAESLGISRQAGYASIKRCGIPVDGGLVDVDVATMLHRKRTRTRTNEKRHQGEAPGRAPVDLAEAAAGVGAGSGEAGNYWESRSRREQAEAELAELKLAEQRAELVRAPDVRAAWAKRAAGLREALLQMPARLAAVLAAETDQARCHDVMQAELHSVLAQITEGTA